MRLYRLVFIVILFVGSFFIINCAVGQADVPIGAWRTHLSYRNLNNLAIVGDQVYASGNFSFMYFDLEDNSVNKLSKLNGFSEADISALKYDDQQNLLIIGYSNGNIDLVKNGKIVNVNSLKNSPHAGSKRINDISFYGNTAYLSSDVGLVVLNIPRKEIREIYSNIGPGGIVSPIYSSTIVNDSLVLASEYGVIAGALDERVNLMYFGNWKRYTIEDGIPALPVKSLSNLNGTLYAAVEGEGLFVKGSGQWIASEFNFPSAINNLSLSGNSILISLQNSLYISDGSNSFTRIEGEAIKNPGKAAFDKNGHLWIADRVNGLLSNFEGDFRAYIPEGPLANNISRLYAYSDKVVAMAGGMGTDIAASVGEGAFYVFENGRWKSFARSLNNLPEVAELVDAQFVPQNGKVFFASFGSGLIQWAPEGQVEIVNAETPGSSLMSANGATLISGLAQSAQGVVWLTNYGVSSPLHSFKPDNEWQHFNFAQPNSRFPLNIALSSNGDKWLSLRTERGGEILVYNEDKGTSRLLRSVHNDGAIPGNLVTDIVEDYEGQMWVGTDNGIGYYRDPWLVLEGNSLNIFIPRYDNANVLRGEYVTSIKVDGGNNKWIGTRNGLYHFSEVGDGFLRHYSTDNSPVPGNHILDIEIDETSGEVFIATDKGLVSMRGAATRGTAEHQNVKIFPNPVSPQFTGILGISGLSNNAIVKIVDMGGRLVRQLYAEGSTASWDINDNRGRRVRGGIYLVLSSSADGEETHIGKIAVIE